MNAADHDFSARASGRNSSLSLAPRDPRRHSGVTRYTTSGFLRTKLGDALAQRAVAPHIYESAEEAGAHFRELEGRKAG